MQAKGESYLSQEDFLLVHFAHHFLLDSTHERVPLLSVLELDFGPGNQASLFPFSISVLLDHSLQSSDLASELFVFECHHSFPSLWVFLQPCLFPR